jgi:branched-chain amino acid transport system permease protein
VSDVVSTRVDSPSDAGSSPPPARVGGWSSPLRPTPGTLLRIALVVVVALLPLWLTPSLQQIGLFAMAAIIGAIGLNLLLGNTGQLSLAHAFFLAVGAYGYAYLGGESGRAGGIEFQGLGLPPLLAALLSVLLAGFFGLLFSPISSRLRGIYLGIASLALVFIGQHFLFTAGSITGGFNGRNVPVFEIFGFQFANTSPQMYFLGIPWGRTERLWYLGLFLVVAAYIFAKNVLRGRPGGAMQMVRDSEVAASVMGVDVRRYKAYAFVLSSLYAGLAGVLFALTFQRIVPDTFGFALSIEFLAMVVIGGLASVGGAALGAVFVIALPQLLAQYSSAVPFLAAPGSGGIDAGTFARFLYGAAIVAFILFEPGGLASIGRRISGRFRRPGGGPPGEPGRLAAPTRGGPPATGSEAPAQSSG